MDTAPPQIRGCAIPVRVIPAEVPPEILRTTHPATGNALGIEHRPAAHHEGNLCAVSFNIANRRKASTFTVYLSGGPCSQIFFARNHAVSVIKAWSASINQKANRI